MSSWKNDRELGMRTALRLVEASDDEWPVLLETLRRQGKLTPAIHQMNRMLRDPEHHDLAERALKKVGFHFDC